MRSFTKWHEDLWPGAPVPDDSSIKAITDDQSWQHALEEDVAFIYKHSPICNQSSMAHRELTRFASTNTRVPIYMVDVLGNRRMSNRIENELRITHESPQLILLASGIPQWNESHWAIKADAMTVELAKLEKQND